MKKYNKQTAGMILTLGLGLGFTSLTTHTAQAQEVKEAPTPAAIPTPALSVGDAFPKNALEGITWIQGDPVTSLDEAGKVYIIECWATWCGPCIRVIPHVNELHKEFADKGLVIIGMNVFEDGIEKSQNFVKKMGDGMSYRVAYSGGRKAAFADTVLKPAKVTGIPRALVIKDGKLILSIHPSQLTTERVAGIIDGSFDAETYGKEQAAKEKERRDFSEKIVALNKAGDWEALKEVALGLEDTNSMKYGLLARAAAKSSNWEDLLALRNDITNKRFGSSVRMSMLNSTIIRDTPITPETAAAAKTYADIVLAGAPDLPADATPLATTFHHVTKARLNFMAGNTDLAKTDLAAAAEAQEKITDPRTSAYYGKLVSNAIKKVDQNTFPPTSELLK
ncbi:MAG: TlpA family protein disulfide reductase [Akkermansiaceae bacterium]